MRATEEVEATLRLDVAVAEEVVEAAAVVLLDRAVLEEDVVDEVVVFAEVDSDDETTDVVEGVVVVCVAVATVDVTLAVSCANAGTTDREKIIMPARRQDIVFLKILI